MGFFLEIVRLGLGNLRIHLLRSFLTSLGIILGVASVIVMVSLGEGNKQAALRDIQALGATNVIVRSTRPPESNSFGSQERSFVAEFGLKEVDLRRIEEFMPDTAHIVPLKAIGSEISYGSKRTTSQSFGTTPDLINAANLGVTRGRYLTEQDMIDRTSVCVIGDDLARQFFTIDDPIGAKIRIDDRVLQVIGVLDPVGIAAGRGSALVGRDWNKDVHIPWSTAKLEFGDVVMRRTSGSFSGEEVQVSEIYITALSTDDVITTANRVRRLVEVDHPEMSDVTINVPWELLENAKRTQLVWDIVFIAIAAISLLIGGIGIMNIMLATVTERTREIGIRRALGATRRHIVAQFLVETGSLSAVGGVLGIGLGVGLSLLVGRFLPWLLELLRRRGVFETEFTLETQVTVWSIVVSFVVATFVGLVFGIYPAMVASRHDPVVALRHD
ncbi:MAG: ABC transporter permease [Planctomycetota bacterium]